MTFTCSSCKKSIPLDKIESFYKDDPTKIALLHEDLDIFVENVVNRDQLIVCTWGNCLEFKGPNSGLCEGEVLELK